MTHCEERFTFENLTGEYFCKNCLQLRCSFRDKIELCGNCGSKDIVIGKVMKLDKDSLIKEVLNERKRNNRELRRSRKSS